MAVSGVAGIGRPQITSGASPAVSPATMRNLRGPSSAASTADAADSSPAQTVAASLKSLEQLGTAIDTTA